jgi:cysteine-rich repeat protein
MTALRLDKIRTGFYGLIIAGFLLPPVALGAGFENCGNGVVDPFEQCDDSNRVNGDGCSSICQVEGDTFPVVVYEAGNPPPTPALEDLPLLTHITQQGIIWALAAPTRVGRFVNGDYYVVGTVTITDIQPLPTYSNGRHGSMLDIPASLEKSGFDSRIVEGRYDPTLRVYPPLILQPGHRLVSSRSAASNLPAVMRPFDTSVSPVASVSILTSMSAPQPLDAFRPSYAQGSTNIYLSRNLERAILPSLSPVTDMPPLSEFEGYLKRPWIDSVFFSFAVPAEYMASYGRENAYLISFAGLLLTMDFPPSQKEPLLVYLTQYGIDLFGLVEQGRSGWQAHGGHGSGRKFPILLAGLMLNENSMKQVQANFGEDMQTIRVTETPPAETYTESWHRTPQTVVYGGHIGKEGESYQAGWGPYEHLHPAQWKSTLGEDYRRCCTSVGWVGESLAARLIPGMQAAWNHPQFFDYVDRWMKVADDPADLAEIDAAWGTSYDRDFQQGQSWRILSGGGYYTGWRTFVDDMWTAYRNIPGLCDHPVFVDPHPFDSIRAGYQWAEAGDMIKVTASVQSGDQDFNEDKNVSMIGGYDCHFGTSASFTTVAGSLIVSRGSVELANVQIK